VREEEQYNTAAEIAAVEEREFEQILADRVLRDYGRE
jgi:predicted HTH domain antitoxin